MTTVHNDQKCNCTVYIQNLGLFATATAQIAHTQTERVNGRRLDDGCLHHQHQRIEIHPTIANNRNTFIFSHMFARSLSVSNTQPVSRQSRPVANGHLSNNKTFSCPPMPRIIPAGLPAPCKIFIYKQTSSSR